MKTKYVILTKIQLSVMTGTGSLTSNIGWRIKIGRART